MKPSLDRRASEAVCPSSMPLTSFCGITSDLKVNLPRPSLDERPREECLSIGVVGCRVGVGTVASGLAFEGLTEARVWSGAGTSRRRVPCEGFNDGLGWVGIAAALSGAACEGLSEARCWVDTGASLRGVAEMRERRFDISISMIRVGRRVLLWKVNSNCLLKNETERLSEKSGWKCERHVCLVQ